MYLHKGRKYRNSNNNPFLDISYNLPDNVNSTVRLFADDCVLCRKFSRSEDQQILQDNLDKLAHWEEAWLMKNSVQKEASAEGMSRGRV